MAITKTQPILDIDEIDKTDRKSVEAILTDLKGAYDRIGRAGRKWVNLSEETRQAVISATPPAMRNVWTKLDQVGNGSLHPQLVTSQGIAARYLSRLPLEQQEHYLSELMDVAITNNRQPDILKIGVEAMSEAQRKQVFCVTGGSVKVRTIAEQKAWLAEQSRKERLKEEKAETTKIERPGKWSIEKGRVFIDPKKYEAGLTKNDVAAILRDLNL